MDPQAKNTIPAAPEVRAPDPGALAALEAKYSAKLSDGGVPRSIQRRKGSIVIDPSLCEPDTFDAPIEIGLEGINAKAELEALKSATDGASAGFAMAKLGMKTLNGAPMRKHQVDLVWECIGFAGRAAVVNAYLVQCTGAGGADLGKSLGISEEE